MGASQAVAQCQCCLSFLYSPHLSLSTDPSHVGTLVGLGICKALGSGAMWGKNWVGLETGPPEVQACRQ